MTTWKRSWPNRAARAAVSLIRELGARFDRGQRAAAGGTDHQLVEQGAEVALAGAAIDDRRFAVAGEHVVERGLQQADETLDLFQLAARIGVEVAVVREEMCRS